MRANIGVTSGGLPIDIETSPPRVLLSSNMAAKDLFEIFCVMTYLSVRERNSWRFVIDGPVVFRKILSDLASNPAVKMALSESRQHQPRRTFRNDIEDGRSLVLPVYRA
jgi:hypothetical protein